MKIVIVSFILLFVSVKSHAQLRSDSANPGVVDTAFWGRFNGVHLKKVLDKVAEHYNYSVVFNGKLPHVGVYASFYKRDSIEQALLELQYLFGFKYKIKNDTLIITPKKR